MLIEGMEQTQNSLGSAAHSLRACADSMVTIAVGVFRARATFLRPLCFTKRSPQEKE